MKIKESIHSRRERIQDYLHCIMPREFSNSPLILEETLKNIKKIVTLALLNLEKEIISTKHQKKDKNLPFTAEFIGNGGLDPVGIVLLRDIVQSVVPPGVLVSVFGSYSKEKNHSFHSKAQCLKGAYHLEFQWKNDVTPILSALPLPKANTQALNKVESLWLKALKGEGTDFKIRYNQSTFSFHSILFQDIPYFQTLFNSGLKESIEKEIVIKETTETALKLYLEFIYKGQAEKAIETDLEDLIAFYDLSDRFLHQEAKEYVLQVIGNRLPALQVTEVNWRMLINLGLKHNESTFVACGLQSGYSLGKIQFTALITHFYPCEEIQKLSHLAKGNLDQKILSTLDQIAKIKESFHDENEV